VSVSVFGEFYP